jgi:hypothetical protein
MTSRLFERQVDVRGQLSTQNRNKLRAMSQRAGLAHKTSMERFGLYPVEHQPETLYARPIPLGRGLTEAYTDGYEQTINLYTIPGTPHYGQFMDWLGNGGMKGRMARYILSKYGNPASARERNEYAIYHEVGHELTQIRHTQREDGTFAEPIVGIIRKQLTKAYSRNLKKGTKWLAPLISRLTYRAFAEGLNELQTENAKNGKTALEVRNERIGQPTGYDFLAATTGDAAYRSDLEPGSETMDLYRRSVDNPYIMGEFLEGHSLFQMAVHQLNNPGYCRN